MFAVIHWVSGTNKRGHKGIVSQLSAPMAMNLRIELNPRRQGVIREKVFTWAKNAR